MSIVKENEVKTCVKPVSYTHLDVYKRQLERFEIYKAIKEDHNRILNEKAIHTNNVLFNRIDHIEREIGYIRSIKLNQGQTGID